jgi:glutamate--cysteine ligase
MHPTNPTSLKNTVANALARNHEAIDRWFAEKFALTPAAFYCSVDIRDSGDKIAPVDCNLYPAGFNNLCEIDLEEAATHFREEFEKIARSIPSQIPEKIGILPESHTENRFYLENLYSLKEIFEKAGFETEVMRLEDLPAPLQLKTASEKTVMEHPIRIRNGVATTDSGFTPDWIVLNADFSSGYPRILESVRQPILPSYRLGWHTRKKSTHFGFYNQLAAEFASIAGIDAWSIQIDSEAVGDVNFGEEIGLDRVNEVAQRMFARIEEQYRKHGITRKPALFIKNDSGTYGMGIMVAHSMDELISMNRRTKTKMSTGKGKSLINRVLIQEGIPTQLITDGSTSEPVIYMLGERLIGGFIRGNTERNDMDNLNSQGMFFRKLCFKDLSDALKTQNFEDFPTLEAVYGTIAKLSALAAASEIRQALHP